jgi:hypothetical protein
MNSHACTMDIYNLLATNIAVMHIQPADILFVVVHYNSISIEEFRTIVYSETFII